MNISIVAAFAASKIIGHEGTIPWHLKEDLVHFRNLTKGSDQLEEVREDQGKNLARLLGAIFHKNNLPW